MPESFEMMRAVPPRAASSSRRRPIIIQTPARASPLLFKAQPGGEIVQPISSDIWKASPPDFILSDGEVHVWRASLDVPAPHLRRFLAMLSVDERTRHERFHFQNDRDHFAVARGFMRTLLGRYLRREPASLVFEYGPQGKPSLKTDAVGEREAGEMLRFNLSHSGGIALLALATRRDVGVDVEFMRDQISTDDLANRFFSHRESATLRALAPELRRTAFFKCWTRKEAFIKAKGGGLSIPLDQFDVAFAPTEQPALLRTAWDTNEASLWSMHDLAAGEEYAAALVVQDSPRRISCWQFTSAL